MKALLVFTGLCLQCVVISSQRNPNAKEVSAEVCQTEQLRAECGEHEVITMATATYGRMQIGRCVKRNMGYLGCQSDVTGILDAVCSGRRACSVDVPDPSLESTAPCLEELKSYLHATYTCLEVISPMNSCENTPIRLTQPRGFLSSHVAMATGCGLETSPWSIQAEPGQRINITVYDYSAPVNAGFSYSGVPPQCTEFAFLFDRSSGRKIKLCSNGRRVTHAYTSENNTLDVSMRSHVVASERPAFLIQYQVIGCVDMVVAPDMEFERTSFLTATLRCPDTQQSYDVICDNNTWKGHWQNCSKVAAGPQDSPATKHSLTDALVLMTVVAVSVVILTILVATLVICVRRMNRRPRHPHYPYDTTCYSSSPQQDNHANLKQLHIDSQTDMEIRQHDVIYRPLVTSHKGQVVSQPPCHICTLRAHGHTYELPPNGRTFSASKSNPRLFNNHQAIKESNLRNDLTLQKQRSNTIHGCHNHKKNKSVHGHGQKCKCTIADENKPMNKSLDCEMMLDTDAEMHKHNQVARQMSESNMLHESLLNNTL